MSNETTSESKKIQYMRHFRRNIISEELIGAGGYLKITAPQLQELGDLFGTIFKEGMEEGRRRQKRDIKKLINKL